MSAEYLLYYLGFGLPFALALAIASIVGWLIRRDMGFAVANLVVTICISFAAVAIEAAPELTTRTARMAAGASAIAAGISFAIVLGVARVSREAAEREGGNLLASVVMMGVATAGALGAVILTAAMTEATWQNDVAQSLVIYLLAFMVIGWGISSWNEDTKQPSQASATDEQAGDSGLSSDSNTSESQTRRWLGAHSSSANGPNSKWKVLRPKK